MRCAVCGRSADPGITHPTLPDVVVCSSFCEAGLTTERANEAQMWADFEALPDLAKSTPAASGPKEDTDG